MLVRYPSKVGSDNFRLGRVVQLHPDAHGVTRTVTLWLRNRVAGARERSAECAAGVTPLVAPVQRLVMILPAQEQPPELISELKDSLGRGELPGEVGEAEGGEEQLDPGVEQGEDLGEDVQPEPEEGGAGTSRHSTPRGPRISVQVPQDPIPQMLDLSPQPQRQRGRRIARPDWSRLLN